MHHFADRLATAIEAKGNPVVVGLDPHRALLPPGFGIERETDSQAVANAYGAFCREVIDVVAPLVPAVKPQAAFFEEYGACGVAALAGVIFYARSKGLLVLLDGKRNDIGSTATAYASGLLGSSESMGVSTGESSLAADALTVSPYLGDDSLQPFIDTATERGCGIFVLVKTSNPGGGMLQDLIAEGQPIYRHVAKYVEALAEQSLGDRGYGAVGAVVGATYPEQLAELRTAMPQTWFLVPGYGSQGGTAADVATAFDSRGLGALVNNSRGILFAYRRPESAGRFAAHQWQDATLAATREMIAELRSETPVSNLKEPTGGRG